MVKVEREIEKEALMHYMVILCSQQQSGTLHKARKQAVLAIEYAMQIKFQNVLVCEC